MREHAAAELELLTREVAAAATVAAFAPILALAAHGSAATAGQQCEHCCHWSLPLNAPYRGRDTDPPGVPMYYHEWLTWDLHVRCHQRLDRPDTQRPVA